MYKSYYHAEHGLMYHVSALLVEDSVLVYQTEGAIFFLFIFCYIDNNKSISYNILNKTTGKDGHTPSDPGKLIDY